MKLFQGKLKSIVYLCGAALVALPLLVAFPQHAAPQPAVTPLVLNVDPSESTIRWTLGSSLHTVHGTFALKSGSLQIDPTTGKSSGAIVADATSGESGNDGRDRKMHKDVLESARFSEIVFRPDSVTDNLALQGDSTVQLHGVFLLHGNEHDLTVPVQAKFAGNHWSGSTKFSVPFIDWGLKNPSTWLLKVDHSVAVEMELKGTVQAPAAQ